LSLALGETLEEKVQAVRNQQSQSMLEAELGALDSQSTNRKTVLPNADMRNGAGRSHVRRTPALDSMISGPAGFDSLANLPDTIWVQDSLGRLVPQPRQANAMRVKRYEQRIFGNLDAAAFSSVSGSAGRNYILGAGDEVVVSLWGDKEKEYSLSLNNEGKVFLEGIGIVALAGNNLDQALQILKQKLSKVYSGIGRGTTHIDISLGKAGPIRVFVLGEVKVPGGYVFTGHTSVLSAMYYGKGPTDIGTVRNLQLTRAGNKFSLDLYRYLLMGESLSPHSLQDGDILFAGRAEILVGVEGDVGRPAVYELKKGEGVKEALQFAGGVNSTAAQHRLTLRRVTPGGKLEWFDLATPQDFLTGKAKVDLQDGDTLAVDKSTESPANYLVISGPVKYPGTYEATGIQSVAQLVAKAGGLKEDAYLGRVNVVRFHPDGSSDLLAYRIDSTNADSIELRPRDNVILYSVKEMYLPDSVQIAGAVFNPGKYEFRRGMTIKDLVMQAGGFLPRHEEGKALLFRSSGNLRKVEQIPISLAGGLAKIEVGIALQANDFIQIPVDPEWYRKEIVTLEGQFMHPGKYALLFPGEKLAAVIDRVGGFRNNAYIEGGRFYRSRDSVGRVGVDIRKALKHPSSKTNIPLVGGDSIYVPERLTTVKVIGEVGFETSLLYQAGSPVSYYIERAGGFTRRSERDRVVVQYANGESSRDGYFNRKPDAGSVIYVPRGPEPKSIDWISGINALLATMGVAAAVILSIQAISN
jgi:protein involved in polysaccharide export with SLBB domain